MANNTHAMMPKISSVGVRASADNRAALRASAMTLTTEKNTVTAVTAIMRNRMPFKVLKPVPHLCPGAHLSAELLRF
jgi:hypothetical protein